MRTFVIGDIHGDHVMLQALLDRAGVRLPDVLDGKVEVISLGDLGDYRREWVRDNLAWQLAERYRFNVLWGNHEAAIFNAGHAFKGFLLPMHHTLDIMSRMQFSYALARNGFLLTHAGLSPHFMTLWEDPVIMADILTRECNTPGWNMVRDSIGPARGGSDVAGGILWRSDSEPVAPVQQIFGHTPGSLVRTFNEGQSFCIDVGGGKSGRLAGLWLDTMRMVAVGDGADLIENYPPMEM